MYKPYLILLTGLIVLFSCQPEEQEPEPSPSQSNCHGWNNARYYHGSYLYQYVDCAVCYYYPNKNKYFISFGFFTLQLSHPLTVGIYPVNDQKKFGASAKFFVPQSNHYSQLIDIDYDGGYIEITSVDSNILFGRFELWLGGNPAVKNGTLDSIPIITN